MLLTIELVPSTCWYSNVRTEVSPQLWRQIARQCYQQAGYQCEICKQTGQFQGYRHKVECHEIWQYDDQNRIQKLSGLIALCPLCHQIKHAGLTITRKGLPFVLDRLVRVNDWTYEQAADHIEQVFTIWQMRSRHTWILDISFLDHYIKQNRILIPHSQ